MHLAARAVGALLLPIASGAAPEHRDYVSQVFRLAGLLHDVGHCAFSHSIEHVSIENQPLLGSLESFYREWGETDGLLSELEAAEPEVSKKPVEHEHIGFLLAKRVLVDLKEHDFARDVPAVLHGALETSARFATSARSVGAAFHKACPNLGLQDDDVFPRQLARVLHDLVSGTLDVDRLDYLIRDSVFCGASYGRCETGLLADSVGMARVGEMATLTISRRARYALEDMIWSRYQMFAQVYNHKANVGLNLSLRQALEDAVSDARIDRPVSMADFLGFTDDYVMSSIHRAALKGKLSAKSFTKALVDRQLYKHLDALDVSSYEDEDDGKEKRKQAVKEHREKLAGEQKLDAAEVLTTEAKSVLVKPGAIFVADGGSFVPWEMSTKVRSGTHRMVHFYRERPQAG